MSDKSAAVVKFIASLMPHYTLEQVNEAWCARSLEDGTLISPADESESDEPRGIVRVQWQGSPDREQEADGTAIAALALVRYVELHQLAQPDKRKATMYAELAFHFQLKTGCVLPTPEYLQDSALSDALARAVGRFGESAVVNALLKMLGAP